MKLFSITLSFTLFFLMLQGCGAPIEDEKQRPEFMGKFDSLMVASNEGPSAEYIYENMVHHLSFPSSDSLSIFADIYEIDSTPVQILLCHQAGYSKGEYLRTGIVLSQMGYNCMAIDQRSGGAVNNIDNKTAEIAIDQNQDITYLSAQKDIQAAIDHLYECNGGKKIILVGSSYSASLALLEALNNDKLMAAAAFSPGEYLKGINLKDSIGEIDIPLFVTSSKMEIPQVEQIVENIDSSLVMHYQPEIEGIHGSSALWGSTEGYASYWQSFLTFLEQNLRGEAQP